MLFKKSRYENTPTIIRDNIRVLQGRKIESGKTDHYTYIVMRGDTLDNIANVCYGDSNLWWKILDSNPKYNSPLDIKPGDTLLIPMKE